MEKIKLEVELTEDQAELLTDILSDHWDEGPEHAGWQSNELSALSGLISEAIEKAS